MTRYCLPHAAASRTSSVDGVNGHSHVVLDNETKGRRPLAAVFIDKFKAVLVIPGDGQIVVNRFAATCNLNGNLSGTV